MDATANSLVGTRSGSKVVIPLRDGSVATVTASLEAGVHHGPHSRADRPCRSGRPSGPVAEAAPQAPQAPGATARRGPPARGYTLVDLGTPGGTDPYNVYSSSAEAINAKGQVAGDTVSGNYGHYGYVWQAGEVESWGVGSGPHGGGQATDINANRQAVGSIVDTRSAFLWQDGTRTDLGTPYNRSWGDRSAAEAINDSAQIVGWMYDHLGPDRAFLWAHGVFSDLGTLDGRPVGPTTSTTPQWWSAPPRCRPATGAHSYGRTG